MTDTKSPQPREDSPDNPSRSASLKRLGWVVLVVALVAILGSFLQTRFKRVGKSSAKETPMMGCGGMDNTAQTRLGTKKAAFNGAAGDHSHWTYQGTSCTLEMCGSQTLGTNQPKHCVAVGKAEQVEMFLCEQTPTQPIEKSGTTVTQANFMECRKWPGSGIEAGYDSGKLNSGFTLGGFSYSGKLTCGSSTPPETTEPKSTTTQTTTTTPPINQMRNYQYSLYQSSCTQPKDTAIACKGDWVAKAWNQQTLATTNYQYCMPEKITTRVVVSSSVFVDGQATQKPCLFGKISYAEVSANNPYANACLLLSPKPSETKDQPTTLSMKYHFVVINPTDAKNSDAGTLPDLTTFYQQVKDCNTSKDASFRFKIQFLNTNQDVIRTHTFDGVKLQDPPGDSKATLSFTATTIL